MEVNNIDRFGSSEVILNVGKGGIVVTYPKKLAKTEISSRTELESSERLVLKEGGEIENESPVSATPTREVHNRKLEDIIESIVSLAYNSNDPIENGGKTQTTKIPVPSPHTDLVIKKVKTSKQNVNHSLPIFPLKNIKIVSIPGNQIRKWVKIQPRCPVELFLLPKSPQLEKPKAAKEIRLLQYIKPAKNTKNPMPKPAKNDESSQPKPSPKPVRKNCSTAKSGGSSTDKPVRKYQRKAPATKKSINSDINYKQRCSSPINSISIWNYSWNSFDAEDKELIESRDSSVAGEIPPNFSCLEGATEEPSSGCVQQWLVNEFYSEENLQLYQMFQEPVSEFEDWSTTDYQENVSIFDTDANSISKASISIDGEQPAKIVEDSGTGFTGFEDKDEVGVGNYDIDADYLDYMDSATLVKIEEDSDSGENDGTSNMDFECEEIESNIASESESESGSETETATESDDHKE